MKSLLALLLCAQAAAFAPESRHAFMSAEKRSATRLYASDTPFAVIVKATIEPDRMGEFMEMIQNNAENTRKEPACIRFDVLRSQDAQNEFFFYELYKNEEAIDFHKQQDHYKRWADFKESGGVISSESFKSDAEFLT